MAVSVVVDPLRRPRSPRNGLFGAAVAVLTLGAALAGAGVALVDCQPELLLVLVSLVGAPLVLWSVSRAPAITIAFIVFAQVLEKYELATPVGTLSPAMVALGLFLFVRLDDVLALAVGPCRVASVLLAFYVGAHAVQFLHLDAGSAIRQVITPASFAAYAVLGMYVGTSSALRRAAAMGAAGALSVLAALSLAANLGIVAFPAVTQAPRDILGIASPFIRNYGIDTATIGLFLALCVPWLAWSARSSKSGAGRVGSAGLLLAISLASLLLFQSRSMVLEIALGSAMVWALIGRSFRAAVVLLLFAGLAAVAFGVVLATGSDAVSTDLRTESYGSAISYLLANPSVFALGTDPTAFHLLVNSGLTYGDQISASAPTHDLVIEVLIQGGIVAAGALVGLWAYPLLLHAKGVRRSRAVSPVAAMSVAAVSLGVLEVSVTPGIANSAPLWIALGAAVGAARSPRSATAASVRATRHSRSQPRFAVSGTLRSTSGATVMGASGR